MYRCKEEFTTVYKGIGFRVLKGTEYNDDSEVVLKNKSKFEKVEMVLLFEEPVSDLEVVIEDVVVDIQEVEEKSYNRKNKKFSK